MLLSNCTEAELAVLRQVVELHPKIKYLAFHHHHDNNNSQKRRDVLVLAQAHEKLSLAKWRESIHPRLQGVTPVLCMRSALESARQQDGFEEFGRYSKPKPSPGAARASQTDRHAPANMLEIMLKARNSFLQTLAVFFQPPGQPLSPTGLSIHTRESLARAAVFPG